MTQRRRIAIIYAFAVPAVLAVVLFERIAFLRVDTVQSQMSNTAAALHQCDLALSLLRGTEGRTDPSSGEAFNAASYERPASQLSGVLQRLRELTRDEPATQSQLRDLDQLIDQRTGVLRLAKAESDARGKTQNRAALEGEDQKSPEATVNLVGEIRTAQQIRLQEQGELAAQSVRWANLTITYGGFLFLWLVGVAAFLLFHDERAHAWTGVERQVHTRILEDLPLGVCLATSAGTLLYANRAEDAILGYEAGELIGKNVIDLHSASDAESAFAEVVDLLPPGQTWSGELNLRKKDQALLKSASWIMNLEVAGKFFRLFIHDPHSWLSNDPQKHQISVGCS